MFHAIVLERRKGLGALAHRPPTDKLNIKVLLKKRMFASNQFLKRRARTSAENPTQHFRNVFRGGENSSEMLGFAQKFYY